jgi:hypothetical protein
VGSKYASFSFAFPAEEVSSMIVDFEVPELARTPRDLKHLTILEQTDSFHPATGQLRLEIKRFPTCIPRSFASCFILS